MAQGMRPKTASSQGSPRQWQEFRVGRDEERSKELRSFAKRPVGPHSSHWLRLIP